MRKSTIFIPLFLFIILFFNGCRKKETHPFPTTFKLDTPLNEEGYDSKDTIPLKGHFFSAEGITHYLIEVKNDANQTIETLVSKNVSSNLVPFDHQLVLSNQLYESDRNYRIRFVPQPNPYVDAFTKSFSTKSSGSFIQPVLYLIYGFSTQTRVRVTDLNFKNSEREYVLNDAYGGGITFDQQLYIYGRTVDPLIKITPTGHGSTFLSRTPNSNTNYFSSITANEKALVIGTGEPSYFLQRYNTGLANVASGKINQTSLQLLEVGDFIFSIEKSANDPTYEWVVYFSKTGAVQSTQDARRSNATGGLFSFNLAEKVYAFHFNNGKTQIDRLAKNLNNVSTIKTLDGNCLNQNAVNLNDAKRIIPTTDQLYLFDQFEQVTKIDLDVRSILKVRYDKKNDLLGVLTTRNLQLFNYSTLQLVSTTPNSGIIDFHFIE